MFREAHRVHEALDTAAGRLLLARGTDEVWAEATGGRTRPSNRDKRQWSDASFLLLPPDGDRPVAELAVPVLDRTGNRWPRSAPAAIRRPSRRTC